MIIDSCKKIILQPLVKEIPYRHPEKIFKPFAHQPWSCFLDSVHIREEVGRYSYIGIDPFCKIWSKNKNLFCNNKPVQENPFVFIKKKLHQYYLKNHDGGPPLQGGAMGYFGYELYQHLENIPLHRNDDLPLPDFAIGLYDIIIAFDLRLQKSWIFSSGFPYQKEKQQEYATFRLNTFLKIMQKNTHTDENPAPFLLEEKIQSTFTKKEYVAAIEKVKKYIIAGDIFQANISQRFQGKLLQNANAYAMYETLRKINPAPFSAFLKLSNGYILSASPERFIKLTGSNVETRPIKGTIRKSNIETENILLKKNLLSSIKNRAENIMIVDILRNDLAKVCKIGSVQVSELCALESYATLHHLVSVVKGELKENLTALDVLQACFPGGSITGAPKIRAMQIIQEIEKNTRGPYCGCLGYMGFNGDMDTAIIIRTLIIKNDTITFQTGGGIVFDSNPEQEYEETLEKAKALFQCLQVTI